MTGIRYLTGGCGIVMMTCGGLLLAEQPEPWRIVLWLVAGVLVHDGLVAPLVIAAAALAGAAGVQRRGGARLALIVAGSLTAVALPPLLRPGGVANATVLPLDYPRNWLLAMGVVGCLVLLRAVVHRCVARASRRRRRRRAA